MLILKIIVLVSSPRWIGPAVFICLRKFCLVGWKLLGCWSIVDKVPSSSSCIFRRCINVRDNIIEQSDIISRCNKNIIRINLQTRINRFSPGQHDGDDIVRRKA